MHSALAALVLSLSLPHGAPEPSTDCPCADVAPVAPVATIGAATGAEDERRRGMKDEIAPLVAAFESAWAAGEAPALVAALDAFAPFDNDDVVALCARALRFTVGAAEAERIAKDQVEVQEPQAREQPRFGEEALDDAAFEALLEAKRAEVLELRRHEGAAVVAEAASRQLAGIETKKSVKALVDALADPAVAVNPFAHRHVVDALGEHEETSKQVEDALCELLATFPDLDRARLASAQHPHLPRTTPYTRPLIGAAGYFARRGTTRKAVVEALIDGLMYGADETDSGTTTFELPDGEVVSFDFSGDLGSIDDTSIKAVARECSRALQVVTRERFAPCSRAAQEQARVWLAEKGKKAGIK
jgi:hypothetical protein